MSIEASYVLELVKNCNSSVITCDDCKWCNSGKCRSEQAFNIVCNWDKEKIKYLPENIRQKLFDVLLLDKSKYLD